MKLKLSSIILSIAMLLSPTFALAEGQLNLFSWAGYTPPELVEKFEAETGISVTIDTYDTNEALLAKLKAGGGDYDIIVPAHSLIPILKAEGLIQPIGLKEMANFENLEAAFVDPDWDPEGNYSIPWQAGTTSFAVDTAVHGEPVDSMATLFEPPAELHGKIGMFKGSSDLVTLAQIYLGLPFCSEDPGEWQQVLDLLLAQKPAVRVYGGGNTMREQLVTGELAMVSNYSGQVRRGWRQKSSISYIYPKEGVVGWVDVLAVPAGAKNYESARAFINFVLEPANAGIVSNHAGYSNGVKGSGPYMTEELRTARELNVPEGIPVFFLKACSETATEYESQVMTQLLQ